MTFNKRIQLKKNVHLLESLQGTRQNKNNIVKHDENLMSDAWYPKEVTKHPLRLSIRWAHEPSEKSERAYDERFGWLEAMHIASAREIGSPMVRVSQKHLKSLETINSPSPKNPAIDPFSTTTLEIDHEETIRKIYCIPNNKLEILKTKAN